MNSKLSIFNLRQRMNRGGDGSSPQPLLPLRSTWGRAVPTPFWNRRWILALSALLASAPLLLLSGCGHDQSTNAGSKEATLYTCGMHPQVIQNKPGLCPICGMNLTPIRKQPAANTTGTNPVPASAERKLKYYKST